MTDRIDDYLRDLRKALGHMDRSERDAVLAEVQDHLNQESARLRSDDPTLSDDVAASRAISAFGPVGEIGVAYGGDKAGLGIINRETGEKLLEGIKVTGRVAGRVAIFGGRGLKGVLKFAGIAALSILGVAMVLAVAALIFAGTVITVFDDEIQEAIPRPLYAFNEYWSGAGEAETSAFSESFDVREGVKEFWIDMDLDARSGCGQIRLIDPSGDIQYDSGQVCDDDDSSRGFNFAERGKWTIQYTFVAYTGSASVESYYFESAQ